MKKNDMIELEITDIDVNGSGVGHADGLCVFVRGALPGEQVRAKIIKARKKYALAIADETLRISPQRVRPVCAAFPQCGGCTLQHLSYAGQLEWKTRRVADCLRHIGGVDASVAFTMPSPEMLRYRNKAAFPVADNGEAVQMGFYRARSHEIIEAEDCALQSPRVSLLCSQLKTWIVHCNISAYDENTGKGLLRHAVVRTAQNGDMMLVLCVNGDSIPHEKILLERLVYVLPQLKTVVCSVNKSKGNAILGSLNYPIYGPGFLTETMLGMQLRVGADTFLQVNTRGAELLYQTLLRMLNLSPEDTVLDLYCGMGAISLPAAKQCKYVFGIECVAGAVKNAVANAAINDVQNAEFLCGDVAAVINEAAARLRPAVIIADPPRKGMDEAVVRAILDAAPRKLAYISCDPATLARDLKLLCAGGYQVSAVQPVDMFPQTTHVETICLLSKRNAGHPVEAEINPDELD